MALPSIYCTVDNDIPSISPSNWRDGIYDTGSVTVYVAKIGVVRGLQFELLDANGSTLTDSSTWAGLGGIEGQSETKTLAEMFPTFLPLGGKTLYNSYGGWRIPIIAYYTNTGAPSSVSISTTSAAPGARVTLSWSGASAGSHNEITGYHIYRATSAGGSYSLHASVSSSATSGSYTVTAPTENGVTYYYKVYTIGAAGGYNSAESAAVFVTCNFAAVTAPTSVSLAATNASPGASVLLSWSGATAGVNNAITGYDVHRADSLNGDYALLSTVESTETTASLTVTAPAENLTTYYYRVKTLGTLDGADSDISTAHAALTCTYSAPAAPSTVTVDNAESVYVLPGASVVLRWSGAAGGANNPIAGYKITRDGEDFVTGIDASADSYTVTANDTAGQPYSFAVVTVGAYADSAPSAARVVYSYTDPTAPATLNVSNPMPTVGGRVTLSWSDAAPGGYNEITGYRVYRATTENGNYTLVVEMASTEPAASCFVDAPAQVGAFYYYKVETVGSYSVSGMGETAVSVGAVEASGDDSEVDVIVPPHKRREKRRFIFGDYDTVIDGAWTLTGWTFPEPETQTNFVDVPGRAAGPLDLSTYLTGGDPRYNSREFSATFESSEGTRADRNATIEEMVNRLNGARVDIVFPDDATKYATGRLQIETEYSDPAHAAVVVTATCDPWRYAKEETRVSLTAGEDAKTVVLYNGGRRILVPAVTVSGYDAHVDLSNGAQSWTLAAGVYRLPELVLLRGDTVLTVSGSGVIGFAYREAVL